MPTPILRADKLARTPRWLRRAAWAVLLGLGAAVPVLAAAPWTQNVHGLGRAVAFDPVRRPQVIVSPIQGRVMKWHVVEGTRVTAGQKLVDLVDNDPRRLERLQEQEQFAIQRRNLAELMVDEQDSRKRNVEAERPLLLEQARARLDATEQMVIRERQGFAREKANELREDQNFARLKKLHDNPKFEPGALVSTTELEEAQRRLSLAREMIPLAAAGISVAEKQQTAAAADLKAIDERTQAQVKAEALALKTRQSDLAAAESLLRTVQSEVERQQNQYVAAPAAGTIFRVLANAEAGGQLVNAGQLLAVLVPDIDPAGDPGPGRQPAFAAALGGAATAGPGPLTAGQYPGIVAELVIDGNDLPLVRVGDRALVQFEGWAAVQFASYPDAATGTFEGRVYLVDPTSDGQGHFRILVEPAPGANWPAEAVLRQGVRAQGWVLIQDVKLGYELWRLLNGFPPARPVKDKETRQVLATGPAGR